jgi:CBS domain-containing protein
MELVAGSTENVSRNEWPPCVGDSPLLNRRPVCVRADDKVGQVLATLLDSRMWGAPVIDEHRRYVGTCTLRRIADLCLLVSAETSRLIQSFDYHREDAEGLAARLGSKASMPAAHVLDPEIPTMRASQSLPQALVLLIRRAPFVVVLDEPDGRLAGVITLEQALRAIQARSGAAFSPPA